MKIRFSGNAADKTRFIRRRKAAMPLPPWLFHLMVGAAPSSADCVGTANRNGNAADPFGAGVGGEYEPYDERVEAWLRRYPGF